jgi:dihydrofolate synthase/folylpolyglutamate synthase
MPQSQAGPPDAAALASPRASASASAAAGFLLGRIDYERTPPSGNSADTFRLARMEDFLRRLGDPQFSIPCIHIAGSKGKGSTAAMTAAMLTAAGHRTGLFTSPHISRFEERIQVDSQMIPVDRFEALTDRLRPIAEEMDRLPLGGPTFFELTTALAWLYFVERCVDVVVLEVGLGGRLDATNVCRPLATIITSISRDHMRLLGETLEEIAGEKAGIIKPHVPMLTAVQHPGALGVIRGRSAAQGVACHVVGEEIDLQASRAPSEASPDRLPRYRFDLVNPWREHRGLLAPLPGLHQARNAALAVSALDLLNAEGLLSSSREAICTGLAAVNWPLRIELVGRQPWLILDAAHNEASIEALLQTLQDLPASRRVAVFAASRDKDTGAMLRRLAEGFDELILTRFLDNPRAMAPAELQRLCGPETLSRVRTAPTPTEALDAARAAAGPDGLVCVTGSIFLAAELRGLLELGVGG